MSLAKQAITGGHIEKERSKQRQFHFSAYHYGALAALLLLVVFWPTRNSSSSQTARPLGLQQAAQGASASGLTAAALERASQLLQSGGQLSSTGSPFSCAAAANLTHFKDTLLSKVQGNFSKVFDWADWDRFAPPITCPPERPLTTYGKPNTDGSKLLCQQASNEQEGADTCIIYSLGSHGDFQFEEAMLSSTPCKVFTFDCTYNGSSIHPGRHEYYEWCLGNGEGLYRTWANITQSLGHSRVDLLKMDIEGYEYAVLSSFHSGDALPEEISMEMHLHAQSPQGRQRMTPSGIASVFMHLAHLGYAAYSQEVNHYVNVPCCCEFSFLRVKAGSDCGMQQV